MSTSDAESSGQYKCEEFPIKILSSWNCATKNGLENTLMVQEDLGDDVDPINFMSTDTCIFLTKEGKSTDEKIKEGCSITLQISGNAVISKISVLSEARLVEVHGPCEEYLKTVRGEFLLEIEGTTVYCADIKLDPPCNYLILKFNGLSRESDLWLYGILAQRKLCPSGLNSTHPNGCRNSPFNLEAVDRRLSDLGHDLAGNTQQYKKILELCNVKSIDSQGDNHSVKPSITSLMASMFTRNQLPTSHRKESAVQRDSHLELLLDQKMKQLEQNILIQIDRRIEQMEQRQQAFINATLEKLIRQLQLSTDQPSTSN